MPHSGDDRYVLIYPDQIVDIIELPDGGYDRITLGSLMSDFVVPDNIESIESFGSGTLTANDSDNSIIIYNHTTLYALGGDDVIYTGTNTNRPFVIWAGDGNDTVRTQSGDDFLDGGAGNDSMFSGVGRDTIHGGTGHDFIRSGEGEDDVDGGSGNDNIRAGKGHDIVHGGEGEDILRGQDGNDTVYGGAGDDIITGESGSDWLFGGDGDDKMRGNAGKDTLNGGAGNDLLWGSSNADTFVFDGGDFGDDVVRDYAHQNKYEDTFAISLEYFGDLAPEIDAFMASHVSLVDGGMNALIDLQAVGGGTILIHGYDGMPFDLQALAGDIDFV